MIEILNEDCGVTLSTLDECIDVILTSPPYNTGRELNSERARDNHEARYDIYLDNKTNDEYCDWVVKLFKNFDVVLKDNGCILWNVSYCSDNSAKHNNGDLVWLTIADIIRNTPFTVADRIVWKKKSALPNNVSPNKLTRICEDVFVFCRKSELKTFYSNREVKSVSRTGQKYYVPVYNFIEAKNNDGSCKLNKATFSSDFVIKLLEIYAPKGGLVYDPFMGTGTTAVGCLKYGCNCIGSELSKAQCEFAKERLNDEGFSGNS